MTGVMKGFKGQNTVTRRVQTEFGVSCPSKNGTFARTIRLKTSACYLGIMQWEGSRNCDLTCSWNTGSAECWIRRFLLLGRNGSIRSHSTSIDNAREIHGNALYNNAEPRNQDP